MVIPLIFPNVPQSSLGILRVPQLPPLLGHLPLKNPININQHVSPSPVIDPPGIKHIHRVTTEGLGISWSIEVFKKGATADGQCEYLEDHPRTWIRG